MRPEMKRTGMFLALTGLLLLLTASACKGRTLDNVVPNGDTVEVYPGCGSPVPTDTIQLDQVKL